MEGLHQTGFRRSAGNWQLYAAVTGSAIAMATGATAAELAAADTGVLSTRAIPPGSQNVAILRAAGLAAPVQTAQTTGAPTITPGGIVPIYGSVNTIQPGEWISIYGTNLAATSATWNGDFPQTLGGTSVTINGKPAYLMYVSPTQINLQAPDDTATGSVSVVVTTATGSAIAGVTLSQYAPSFMVVESPIGTPFVSGIILRPDGRGAYGGGSYDLLGPTGKSLGYPTVAAKAGDTVSLYAVGFGPTTPFVASGAAYSGAAPTNAPLTLYIGNVVVQPSFVGISSAGLYQINVTIPPGLGEGAVPIRAMIGGMQTQAVVWFSLEVLPRGGYGGTVGPTGTVGVPIFSFSSNPPIFGGGTFEGGTACCSDGASSDAKRHHKNTWHPKLKFPPK